MEIGAAIVGLGWGCFVLLPVIVAQQLWIYWNARRSAKREELFRMITENAADMIALVSVKGRRLYNSPARDVLEMILALGSKWGLEVSAQGVEKPPTCVALKNHGLPLRTRVPLLGAPDDGLRQGPSPPAGRLRATVHPRALTASRYFAHSVSRNKYRSRNGSFSALGAALKYITRHPLPAS